MSNISHKVTAIPTLYSTTIVLPNLFSIAVVYDEFLLSSYYQLINHPQIYTLRLCA